MFIHIGYGNYINKDELKLMSSQFTTGYYSRLIKNAKMKNNYEGIDFTNGHSKKTFILLNNNNFVYSAIPYSQLMTRYKKCNTFGNKIISLGNGNYINAKQIRFISGNIKSKPISKQLKIAKNNHLCIDFTHNEPTRSLLFMKDGTIITSMFDEHTLIKRILS